MNGHPWTDADLQFLRASYRTQPVCEITAALGRSAKSVYIQAYTLGLTRPQHRVTPADKIEIARLAAAGTCNSCIGRAIGVGRQEVRLWRRRLGIAPLTARGSVATCKQCTERTSATTRRQCKEAGVRNLAEVRAQAYRDYARANGWPDDLRPREVQILNVLADRGVPMTRVELSAAIGMRTDRMGCNGTLALLTGNGPGGTYTANLMRRGLVAKLKRGAAIHGQGKGKSRDLYFLGVKAVTILEELACKTES